MNGALWTAKTGLDAQQTRMSVIANNLANVNTTGFKRDRAAFESLLYQNLRAAGTQSSQDTEIPTGLSVGTGVRIVATEKLFTQGNLTQTGNKFDAAIQGRGFFTVLMPDGSVGYTRDGAFQQDSQGQLVNLNGYPLQPALTIPPGTTSLTIGSDGTVSINIEGSGIPTEIGAIQLADFINPEGLKPEGGNVFSETAASGGAIQGTPGLNGYGSLIQGSLETSNVNVVEELVSMIETQRAYEINSKAISTVDGMLAFANNNM